MFNHNSIKLGTFLHTITFLRHSQWWSKEKLEEYQLQQLKKLLNHAYTNVPYYTKMFNSLKLKPNNIKSFQDLQILPYLTKEIIRNNIDDLKAKIYPEQKFEKSYTGSTTGKPLQFYVEKGEWAAQIVAYGSIQMNWAGRTFFNKCVQISGYIEKPYQYKIFGRALVLSSFHMNDKYLPLFIKKIKKFKPKHILSYPSAITNLAIYIKRNNLEGFSSVKSILCHAETLYEWQRELLEETFQCYVHNQYGQTEPTVFGGSCKHSNYIHMFPEFGITELIGKNGKPVKKEGEIGEIVGTGFHTYIFPFIRYRTGDLGVYTNKKCSCGRNYPLIERIEGRSQEFIVSKSKKLIPLTGVYGLVAKCSQNVNDVQLYQDTEGEIIINIEKRKGYTFEDSNKIKNNFQKRFGDDFIIKINSVDTIPLTKTGKYQFLNQKLDIDFFQ
ncbi:CoF synthetase [Thermoplasmatales archaeon SG8-52-4]|nr:MAG: CoF synthetase [Thermoplasmatales archaeon SG8-52-4]